jgi:hypothetical protein
LSSPGSTVCREDRRLAAQGYSFAEMGSTAWVVVLLAPVEAVGELPPHALAVKASTAAPTVMRTVRFFIGLLLGVGW